MFRSIIGVGVACLFLLCLAACGQSNEHQAAATDQPRVSIYVVKQGGAGLTLKVSGLLGYKREASLTFDTPGVIQSLDVDIGDHVVQGQVLAHLRRTIVGSNAQEAALALENAKRKLARVQALFDKGFASQSDLDEAKLGVERAENSAVIIAPADGVILRRSAEPAQTVAAGTPIFILGDKESGIVVRASASALDAARIKIDAVSRIHIDGIGDREGKVSRIAPKSDDATGAFEIEIMVDTPDNIQSGQVAQVSIESSFANKDGGVLVPALSLLDARADQGSVYVVDTAHIAHRRSIEIGGLVGGDVIVLSGLKPGEAIVAKGAAYVRDGEAVQILPDQKDGPAAAQS